MMGLGLTPRKPKSGNAFASYHLPSQLNTSNANGHGNGIDNGNGHGHGNGNLNGPTSNNSSMNVYDSDAMNTSMDDNDTGSLCSESLTVSSPPQSVVKHRGSFGNRLFVDEEEDVDLNRKPVFGAPFKPLDLNLQLFGAAESSTGQIRDNCEGNGSGASANANTNTNSNTTTTTHTSSCDPGARTPFRTGRPTMKRQAERLPMGRDLSFDMSDEASPRDISPTETMMMMSMQSPRISPLNGFRHSASINKSPRYRTIDGRTVQSKNPFSPMCTDEKSSSYNKTNANSNTNSNASSINSMGKTTPVSLSESLNFPVSLESQQDGNSPGPLLRHRLQKRDTHMNPSVFPSFAAQYDTRDGYPERKGRYSFTGSPIRETGMDIEEHFDSSAPLKLRKLTKPVESQSANNNSIDNNDNDAGDSDSSPTGPSKQNSSLALDTIQANQGPRHENHSTYRWNEDVSPTDVLSFPPSSPCPSTPTKRRVYTPVRKMAVPQTPMPERRARHHQNEQDKLASASSNTSTSSKSSQSRFYSDFDVIGELGNGSFGNVFKVMSRLDGCMYAIKVANRPAKGTADKDRMLKEVYALAALSDQPGIATFHIVRFHQAWMEEHRLYIQTELCTSTLAAEMEDLSPVLLPVSRRYKFVREMCLALEFIHKNGMAHLDIKPENVFIKNDQFKLGDFGLVSKVSSHDVEEGDSRYMSRQLLSGDHTDLTKSDIFSLGISLYEVCLGGVRPLPHNGPEWQALRAATFPPLANTPMEMQNLIRTMMHPEAANRPSAPELLARPQLLSEDQKELLKERNKVAKANFALRQRHQWELPATKPPATLSEPALPPRKVLRRANTWSGF